ncbi:hypothetical protein GAP32_413 [Cronobacter phage vB_CsaM_GAP32]|uniref:Uncharacterized protein n=1 Tax=Cronobacter phage vB_CsaM_GAP32 TaxID=1141136 RepID=K4F6G5_9CAUD|nr:hypothetical protein GAP32_413 [Cronobacter phage vB_CsaM_GAP32]AFC21866.1 hypothetical protein GAP32_413 [Cronobacter phage vB_CsaM_GAP32]
MAIVSNESLEYLKDRRRKAKETTQYDSGYRIAIEALSAAIAQLEQLKTITDGFEVSISIKSDIK